MTADPKPRPRPKRRRSAMAFLAGLVHQRSGSRCERCSGPGEHIHHLAPKGMGGSRHLDTLENLTLVCAKCHLWIHAHPADAYRDGWLRRRG